MREPSGVRSPSARHPRRAAGECRDHERRDEAPRGGERGEGAEGEGRVAGGAEKRGGQARTGALSPSPPSSSVYSPAIS